MLNRTRRAVLAVVSVFTLAIAATASAAAFTPGNIVVYRVGDGVAALGTGAAAAFLAEYTPAGALVQTVPLPTTTVGANRRLTAAGSQAEGLLNRSTNGGFLLVGGYDAAVATATVGTTTSAAVNRVVARVSPSGTIDTTTALTDASSGSNFRSVITTTGTDLWLTGGAGGVRYTIIGSVGTAVVYPRRGRASQFGLRLDGARERRPEETCATELFEPRCHRTLRAAQTVSQAKRQRFTVRVSTRFGVSSTSTQPCPSPMRSV
jgi:hypothetical protein